MRLLSLLVMILPSIGVWNSFLMRRLNHEDITKPMGLQSESDALDNIVNYLVRKKLFGTNKPNQVDAEGGPKNRFIRNPNPSPIYFKPTTTFSDISEDTAGTPVTQNHIYGSDTTASKSKDKPLTTKYFYLSGKRSSLLSGFPGYTKKGSGIRIVG